mmetsp:Transcript_5575/g.11871  ORF Transcript_5575/g.11871 Transcript_5575/m.11871 type:complete len:333 (-) Transcript_5575:79-1077(-)
MLLSHRRLRLSSPPERTQSIHPSGQSHATPQSDRKALLQKRSVAMTVTTRRAAAASNRGNGQARANGNSGAPQQRQAFDWNKCRGFLFDIDGTLVNSDPLHLIAIRGMFERTGLRDVTVDHDFIRENVSGVDNAEIAKKWLPHLLPREEDRIQWAIDKEAYFRQVAEERIDEVAVDGLRELIAWIQQENERGGAAVEFKDKTFFCAAVTNAPRENAEMVLNGLGIADNFDIVVIGPECDRAKPHPEPYLKAMEALGLKPEECVCIEDSVPGVTAGVAANLYTVGCLTSQTDAALRKVGASQTIHDYHELLSEIKRARNGSRTRVLQSQKSLR